MNPSELQRILKAITQSARIHDIDGDSFQCAYEKGSVKVTCATQDDADKMVPSFKAVGMVVTQTSEIFTVRYPTRDEIRRMQ